MIICKLLGHKWIKEKRYIGATISFCEDVIVCKRCKITKEYYEHEKWKRGELK